MGATSVCCRTVPADIVVEYGDGDGGGVSGSRVVVVVVVVDDDELVFDTGRQSNPFTAPPHTPIRMVP